jgi:hypothetical protein
VKGRRVSESALIGVRAGQKDRPAGVLRKTSSPLHYVVRIGQPNGVSDELCLAVKEYVF